TGLRPRLRVIGDGPMAATWRDLAQQLGLESQVRFEGSLHGEPLARALAECRIGVVPSVWEEPMGMVAAEFLAAGVVPLVSERGGLAEVVGSAGLCFANGDPLALAAQLARLLDTTGDSPPAAAASGPDGEPDVELLLRELLGQAPVQLRRFEPARIAARYAALYRRLVGR
ncbi:MAG: glycosyltransferase, partial [Synechococcaceae cyanobacterium]|nr:glycosyltransferase [Synechococcaceae cyanobacterium]